MIRGRFGRNRNIEERTISCNTKDLRHHNSIKNSWWDAAMKVWHANNKKSKVVTFVKQFRWYFTITYSDIQINKSSVRSRMYQFSTSSLEQIYFYDFWISPPPLSGQGSSINQKVPWNFLLHVMPSLITYPVHLPRKPRSCSDRYKLAQNGAGSIPIGIPVVCNTVRFPTSK